MNTKKIITAIFILLFLSNCEKVFFEPDPVNDPANNFEILWKTLDERYSFFEYKDIDWDSVYMAYRPQLRPDMSERELWNLLTDMLDVLRDGHVNLRSEFDIYFWNWWEAAPKNFDRDLLERYYWGNYEITGFLTNTIIDSVGYIYYHSFNGPIQEYQLDYLADKFEGLKGLILDLRDNEGGNPENGFRLARRFADQRRHIYTTIYKDGPEADNFTEPEEAFLEPNGKKRLPGRVVVLTNRTTYSAGNFFAAMMKAFPSVTLLGDRTGGGGGAPVGWELPNGWHFNFSSSITYLPDGSIIEQGVHPDIRIDMNPAEAEAGIDSILKAALDLLD